MCVALVKQKSILSRILGTLKENMGEMRSGLLPGCRAQAGKPLCLCDDPWFSRGWAISEHGSHPQHTEDQITLCLGNCPVYRRVFIYQRDTSSSTHPGCADQTVPWGVNSLPTENLGVVMTGGSMLSPTW